MNLNSLLKKLKKKEKLSNDEISVIANDLIELFNKTTRKKLNSEIAKFYTAAKKDINHHKTKLDAADKTAIEVLQNNSELLTAVKELTAEQAKQITEAFQESYTEGDISIKNLKEKLKHITNKTETDMERIIRTETTKVSNAAKLINYEKLDIDVKYKWQSTPDLRRTDTCKRISSRTRDGVTREELINIIREESRKDFPGWTVDPYAPAAHYNCRATISPVVVKNE